MWFYRLKPHLMIRSIYDFKYTQITYFINWYLQVIMVLLLSLITRPEMTQTFHNRNHFECIFFNLDQTNILMAFFFLLYYAHNYEK